MLKQFPRFKANQSIMEFENLKAKEKNIINDYGKYCGITANENKVKDMKRDVIKLRLVCGNLDKIDLECLRNFLYMLEKSDLMTGAKNNVKIHIQKYLRWHFKDWSERFDEFNDIKTTNGYNEEKINGKILLSKEEIEKIVKKESRTFWKAYFLVQYEGALRTIEARSLKWSDVKLYSDGDISEIHIFSTKTKKARKIFVKEASFYLEKLKEQKEDNSPYVFPSAEDENKPLSKFSVSRFFKNHVSKVVSRKVIPYHLRHTRGHDLYITLGGKIPEKVTQKFMGHKKNMVEVYANLSNEDVKEAMVKQLYQFEDLPPEQEHELKEEVKKMRAELEAIKNYIVKTAIGSKGTEKEKQEMKDRVFSIITKGE